MKKTVLLAAVLTAALAVGAGADMLSTTSWTMYMQDDFEAYAGSTAPLGKAAPTSPPWSQWHLAQYKVFNDAGNTVVKTNACSATYTLRACWRGAGGHAPSESRQLVTFLVRTLAAGVPSDYTLGHIMSSDVNYYGSNAVPGLDMSNQSLRAHVRTGWDFADPGPEWVGPEVSIADGEWHMYAFVWDTTTGDAEWYLDGNLFATLPDDPDLKGYYIGRKGWHFEWWQKYQDANQATELMFDHIRSHGGIPIPEPSSFVAFAAFGIGALGLMRRRKA